MLGSHRISHALAALCAAITLLAAAGTFAQQQVDAALIEEGRRLFLEESFGGNGRTCATCHPPSNNFTIDPAYIARLPGNDPLFGPNAPNALEVRRLLRRFGLILENVDTFDEAGVLRSVPHTLGLRLSLTPDLSEGGRFATAGITEATGWSGDGSPGRSPEDPEGGSLKNFATGAVRQHFTKTLNRQEGVDFRLPTEQELIALAAFQLSLGRQEDIDLAALDFVDTNVQQGKGLFFESPSRNGNGRSCNGCHNNAGANNRNKVNRNFAIGTMFLPNAPACLLGFVPPGDGGFGEEPIEDMRRRDICGKGPNGGPKAIATFRGDLTMNTPSLIEAADTAPFFHNNSAATIEDAVAFYTTNTFNESPSGGGNAFVLTAEQIDQIAALLRALNALENIRSSNAYDEQALMQPLARARESVDLAIAETTDAIEVLTEGPGQLFADTSVVALLEQALTRERLALAQGLPDGPLQEAIVLKEGARDLMLLP